MMLFFLSRNFGKLVKNLKEYKTKLYFTIIVSVIKIDNDFNHRNFDRVSEPIKFRRLSLFSANCPFGKLSVRQNVRSAKRLFGKTSVGKMSVRQNVFRQNVFRQSVFRQNVRPPITTNIWNEAFGAMLESIEKTQYYHHLT